MTYVSQSHFSSTTSGNKFGFQKNVTGNVHGILQISLHFVKYVFRGSAKKNRACFRIFALNNKAEVLITDLLTTECYCIIPDFLVQFLNITFLISKRPAFVPISSSRISSVRLTIVAPDARAIRLLSDFLTRRMAVIPAFNIKFNKM